jgi:hypothetical protein
MIKEAGIPEALSVAQETAKNALEMGRTALPMAIFAPAIAGSAIAIAHSKLTSPSSTEKDVITPQDESLARMYEMEAARRRRELIEGMKSRIAR